MSEPPRGTFFTGCTLTALGLVLRAACSSDSKTARALRSGGAPTGGLTPERLLGHGESQSAFALVTYINGVQPLTKAYDGFEPGKSAELAAALAGTPTVFRTDSDVPTSTCRPRPTSRAC